MYRQAYQRIDMITLIVFLTSISEITIFVIFEL